MFENSHLMQVRGLKLLINTAYMLLPNSHLMQVRGLKQDLRLKIVDKDFAPHAGAWIETVLDMSLCPSNSSHLMQVRGLKHHIASVCQNVQIRTSCRCVD